MLTSEQKTVIAKASELSPHITLREAFRHFSSAQLLDDLIERLKPSGLEASIASSEALRVLVGDGEPNHGDIRRILMLAKAIIRAQKTHEKHQREQHLYANSVLYAQGKKNQAFSSQE